LSPENKLNEKTLKMLTTSTYAERMRPVQSQDSKDQKVEWEPKGLSKLAYLTMKKNPISLKRAQANMNQVWEGHFA